MTPSLLLQHGWAFDRHFWKSWQEFLPFASPIPCRGYFSGDRSMAPPPSPVCPSVIVAHSLGLHLLDRELLENCQLLVLISGFLEFHPLSLEARALSLAHVQQMQQLLAYKEPKVLRQFHMRAGRPHSSQLAALDPFNFPSPELIRWDRLQEDLALLNREGQALRPLEEALKGVPHLLLLHGEKDSIVPLEKSLEIQEKFPQSRLVRFPEAGHALPLTHGAGCWREIFSEISRFLPPVDSARMCHNFSRSAHNYHEQAKVQKQSAADLIRHVQDQRFPKGKILEVGCGTGFVTKELVEQFPECPILATDVAPGMLDYCQATLGQVEGALERLEFRLSSAASPPLDAAPFSLIISGMTLQLVEDFQSALSTLYAQLDEGGLLAFSYLEDGSFCEWKAIAEQCQLPFTRIPLLSSSQLLAFARDLDPHTGLVEESYLEEHPSPLAFFQHLKAIGTANPSPWKPKLRQTEWEKLIGVWRQRFPETTPLTYKVAYVTLRKPLLSPTPLRHRH